MHSGKGDDGRFDLRHSHPAAPAALAVGALRRFCGATTRRRGPEATLGARYVSLGRSSAYLRSACSRRSSDRVSKIETDPREIPRTRAISRYRKPSARRNKQLRHSSGSACTTANSRLCLCADENISSGFGRESNCCSAMSLNMSLRSRILLSASRRLSARL